ncbi:helix-turn-helix domain-containing protein [Streptomyces sp. NPDC047917]|uniref:helix-turn-helix domain-containing protein n=1 Tax=Streptomyces sp. NPDC047917 TaxID=3365491 RepID=UPI0037186EA7
MKNSVSRPHLRGDGYRCPRTNRESRAASSSGLEAVRAELGDGGVHVPGVLPAHQVRQRLERGQDRDSQVHRLVSGTLERLSSQVMAALRDILSCTPADLVATTAENAGVRKTATGDLPTPPSNVAKLRPRAARILPDA